MNLILEKAYEKVCGNCKACLLERWQDCVNNTFNFRRCPFEDEIAGIEDSAKLFLEFVDEIAEKVKDYDPDDLVESA